MADVSLSREASASQPHLASQSSFPGPRARSGTETRERIVEMVQARPGVTHSELLRLTGLGNGALSYQLWRAERLRLIFSRREGKLRAHYPDGFPAPGIGPTPRQCLIMDIVRRRPGASQSEVARLLRLRRQHVNFQVRRLEKNGALRIVRGSGQARCYLALGPAAWNGPDNFPFPADAARLSRPPRSPRGQPPPPPGRW